MCFCVTWYSSSSRLLFPDRSHCVHQIRAHDRGINEKAIPLVQEILSVFGTRLMMDDDFTFSLAPAKSCYLLLCEEAYRERLCLPTLHELLRRCPSDDDTAKSSATVGTVDPLYVQFRQFCERTSHASPYLTFWEGACRYRRLHSHAERLCHTMPASDDAERNTLVEDAVQAVKDAAHDVYRACLLGSDAPVELSAFIALQIQTAFAVPPLKLSVASSSGVEPTASTLVSVFPSASHARALPARHLFDAAVKEVVQWLRNLYPAFIRQVRLPTAATAAAVPVNATASSTNVASQQTTTVDNTASGFSSTHPTHSDDANGFREDRSESVRSLADAAKVMSAVISSPFVGAKAAGSLAAAVGAAQDPSPSGVSTTHSNSPTDLQMPVAATGAGQISHSHSASIAPMNSKRALKFSDLLDPQSSVLVQFGENRSTDASSGTSSSVEAPSPASSLRSPPSASHPVHLGRRASVTMAPVRVDADAVARAQNRRTILLFGAEDEAVSEPSPQSSTITSPPQAQPTVHRTASAPQPAVSHAADAHPPKGNLEAQSVTVSVTPDSTAGSIGAGAGSGVGNIAEELSPRSRALLVQLESMNNQIAHKHSR